MVINVLSSPKENLIENDKNNDISCCEDLHCISCIPHRLIHRLCCMPRCCLLFVSNVLNISQIKILTLQASSLWTLEGIHVEAR